jgi:hypothetical protein
MSEAKAIPDGGNLRGGKSPLRYGNDPRVREQGIDAWYTELLNRNRPRGDRVRSALWGADAGFCPRRNILLQQTGIIDPLENTAGLAFMAIGSAIENLLSDALLKGGRLLGQNLYLVEMPELKVRGKVDFYVFDHEDELALIECKSCGELPAEPKPAHLAQVTTYAAISGLDRAYLTYVSRSVKWKQDIPVKTFVVDTSPPALFEKLRIASLSKLGVEEGFLPPVPAHFRKHTECHYCEFRDLYCYAQRAGQGGELPLPPPILTEVSGASLVPYDMEAQVLAKALMFGRPERRVQTILGLIEEPLAQNHERKLKKALALALKEAKGEPL